MGSAMRKRKEEMENLWYWTKVRMRSDMEDFFIAEGVLLILAFFVLVLTVGGPYIRSEVRYVDETLKITEVPIWIVFLYSGSVAISIGLLLKIPRLFMKLRFLTFSTLIAGLVSACINMLGMAFYFLYWFMSVDIGAYYWLQPILLFVTCYISSVYLYVQGPAIPLLKVIQPPDPIQKTGNPILF